MFNRKMIRTSVPLPVTRRTFLARAAQGAFALTCAPAVLRAAQLSAATAETRSN